jgi:DNA-binding NarL/FixJ family response regulator
MDRPLTFLVVRRDVEHRNELTAELEAHGCVLTASTLYQARATVRAAKLDAIDAVVVDHDLEDGSGLGVVDFIHARETGVCALLVVKEIDPELATRALETGARLCIAPLSARHVAVLVDEARMYREAFDRRVRVVLERWNASYRLTPVEEDLLRRAVHGETRQETAARRRVATETVRKQIQALLRKTKAATFEGAVADLLREACAEPR